MKRSFYSAAAVVLATVFVISANAEEQEVLIEEIIVEAPFDVRLELPSEYAVQKMIERLTLRAETLRVKELAVANQSPVTTILDLTKHSPIPISDTGSGRPIDTFFDQNYMRTDLNPREEDPLRLQKR